MSKKDVTLQQIVEEWLTKRGCDGLYSDWLECACELGELFAGQCAPESDCKPGYKIPDPTGEYEYLIGPKPEAHNG